MNTFFKSFTGSLSANRLGLLIFGILSLLTGAVLMTSKNITAAPNPSNEVKIITQLSQSKLVKGDLNTVYLDVGIQSPGIEADRSSMRASDLIVVLDRSGSMSGTNKMPYAKAAIRELLSRLQGNDRFALISFADQALVHSPLVSVDADRREQLNAMVNTIQPGGGTNIGEGLINAVSLLTEQRQDRISKVLLLSDGQANQGITDLTGLNRIVQQLTQQESVLSSIGMGLDFNETLMSALADYGMGSYHFLEDLAGLGDIFAHSLNATRNIFAANSELHLRLNDGVELIDAAGYPIGKDGNTVHIKTGQLLGNNIKKFVMTFRVKANDAGDFPLGDMQLAYPVQGGNQQQLISAQQLMLTVVEAERRQEAVDSIDKDVYKQSWLKNNFGLMQKKLSRWVREGNKDKADQAINEYRKEIAKAEQQAAMPLVSEELDEKLAEMENGVAEAFNGSFSDQSVKRKRAAKSIQMDAIKQQRSIQQQKP
ncbi:MAG: vWA domain-containing protein [Gammaproteobacteria bacterium]